jgi:hypothetical protein
VVTANYTPVLNNGYTAGVAGLEREVRAVAAENEITCGLVISAYDSPIVNERGAVGVDN